MILYFAAVRQEFADVLKTSLHRPDCMTKVEVVPALVQCPQKPRGRKKAQKSEPSKPSSVDKEPETEPKTTVEQPERRKSKSRKVAAVETVGSNRPSAAACGFSTEGMTDAQVAERLESQHASTDIELSAPKKKQRKAKRSNKRQVETTDVIPSKAASSSNQELSPSKSDPQPAKRRRTRSKAAKVKSHAPGASTDASTGAAASAAMTTSAGENGQESIAEATHVPEPNGDVPADNEAIASNPAMETPAPADPQAEARARTKAKQSRKSAAYHRAALAAKKLGATKEEISAAGKAVSWTILFCHNECVFSVFKN